MARRQRFEGVSHGVLPLLAAVHEDRGSGGVAHQFVKLRGIAIDDGEVVGHAARLECRHGMREDRTAAELGQQLVGHGALHALAGTGGEEDGGDAAHGEGGRD